MLRVLCHCIDFIDFYSANLGPSALGRGVRQYSVTTRGGWGGQSLGVTSPSPS